MRGSMKINIPISLSWVISALISSANICMANEPIKSAIYDPTTDRVLHYQTVSPGPLSQRYQIDLYENGTAVYTGIGNVKSLGQHKLNTNPEQIKKVVQAIWAHAKPHGVQAHPSEVPAPIYLDASPHPLPGDVFAYASIDIPTWMLMVRNQRRTRTFVRWAPDPSYDKWIRQLFETNGLSTKALRCPFSLDANYRVSPRRVLMKGSNLCDFHDESDRYITLPETK